MILETQLHGYRQGHELLGATITLAKTDQSVIDQLSDVAGPLRPGEIFSPYLTTYPLPSGNHYVFARTWQDLTVQRAGCVRTLSVLVPMSVWVEGAAIQRLVEALDSTRFPDEAVSIPVSEEHLAFLPTPAQFQARELLEALFLEESKPVAVFDAPDAELIGLRLIAALWPSMRRRFSMSTFALSPRRIGDGFFDLVFAPKDARPRFSDWPGRRVDGRSDQPPRHRWTNTIVERVFYDPFPRLLSAANSQLAASDEEGSSSALRISLLWEELLSKVESSPVAVLGLLDIANTRLSGNGDAIEKLREILAIAPHRAVSELPSAAAWDFISAMARKLQGSQLSDASHSVFKAAGELARRDAIGAIALMNQAGVEAPNLLRVLAPEIGESLGSSPLSQSAEEALMQSSHVVLSELVVSSEKLARSVAKSERLLPLLGATLSAMPWQLIDGLKAVLLPVLLEDYQLQAALPLFATLSNNELREEVRYLGASNSFAAGAFIQPLIERAREIGVVSSLRGALLEVQKSPSRDHFLARTFTGTTEDFEWLLSQSNMDRVFSAEMIANLLRRMSSSDRAGVFANRDLTDAILSRMSIVDVDLIREILVHEAASLPAHLAATELLLPACSEADRYDLGSRALRRCLPSSFGGDEVNSIVSLLRILGAQVDVRVLGRFGLSREVADVHVSRNLVAFERAPVPARNQMLAEIDVLASAYVERRSYVELDEGGAEAFAALLRDAYIPNKAALTRAASMLLPLLLRSRHMPVSGMVAASFPIVYRELAAKEDDVPDMLKFVPFLDWDRCKSARRELVSSFMSAGNWKPGDLALTACLSGDVAEILGKVARSYGGSAYLQRVEGELSHLPPSCSEWAMNEIAEIRRAEH